MPRFELGPAIQQADELLSEQRRTAYLFKHLHREMISGNAKTDGETGATASGIFHTTLNFYIYIYWPLKVLSSEMDQAESRLIR
jgi:hypothetical protein